MVPETVLSLYSSVTDNEAPRDLDPRDGFELILFGNRQRSS